VANGPNIFQMLLVILAVTKLLHFYSAAVGVEYCDDHVCLSVCQSASISVATCPIVTPVFVHVNEFFVQ